MAVAVGSAVDSKPNNPVQDEINVLHLPDYLFMTYCFETFGLNRGIYNTMDEWLYRFGFKEIVERRKAILSFLASLSVPGRTNGSFLKFGKGGLTKQLSDYMLKLRSEYLSNCRMP